MYLEQGGSECLALGKFVSTETGTSSAACRFKETNPNTRQILAQCVNMDILIGNSSRHGKGSFGDLWAELDPRRRV
jgi:hypothetical protein